MTTTRGIVFHKVKYGESSMILKILTEEYGLQSFMVKGAMGKSSKLKMSYFQPLSLIELEMLYRQGQNLQHLREVRMAHTWQHIPFSIEKQSILMFLNEMIYRSIQQEHPDKELFGWLFNTLVWFDLEKDSYINFHLVFLIQLSRFLGFFPKGAAEKNRDFFDIQEGAFTHSKPGHSYFLEPETTEKLRQIIRTGLDSIGNLKMNNKTRSVMLDALVFYYQLHLPEMGKIKSLEVLRTMSR